jgi:uroporphyrinogen decarboxylase
MTPIERVRAALAGREVDRPPFTVWYHFGLQHARAERTAQAHLEFLDAYRLDWLKVMNDFSYPMPPRLETVTQARELSQIRPLDVHQGGFGEQLEVVRLLGAALKTRVLFVDTVFNAWNTLRRNVLKGAMEVFMAEAPEALETALGVVNDNLIRYALASLQHGAAGIFLSVPATQETLTREQFDRFMRPFDLALLETVRRFGEFHVLHAHGDRLYLDGLLDYPVHAVSWADRAAGPTLGEMRARTPLALMGGIDHTHFPNRDAASLRAEVREAIAAAGRAKLLLAPGCAIPTYSFPELIRAIRDEAERA